MTTIVTCAKGDFVVPGCRICQDVYLALPQALPRLLEAHVEANHHPNPDSEVCLEEGHVRHDWAVQLDLLIPIQMKLSVLGQNFSISAKGQVRVEEFFFLVESQEVHDKVDFVLCCNFGKISLKIL